MRDAPVEPGEILDGKYRVERVLGSGAMGVVVAAVNLALGQRVALKFMHLRGQPEPDQEARFLREARVAAMLRSQHVARVLDVGVLENDAPYIVMELLEGQDLSRVLKARRQLPVAEAVDYVLQACEAVAEAHAAGIVHRDLKPANLFLTQGANGAACVKVLDFGVSKLIGSLELTKTGDALGSPLYMAPEQMRAARDVDARGDIWSLGVILYELLAGQTPFHAETMIALCQRLLSDAPTPLERHRSDVPAALAAVILRCVEKPRELRWPTVTAFAAELLPYASTHPLPFGPRASFASIAPTGSLASTAPPPLTTSATSGGPLVTTVVPSRRRAALFAAGTVAMGVGVGVTLLAFTRERGPAAGGRDEAAGTMVSAAVELPRPAPAPPPVASSAVVPEVIELPELPASAAVPPASSAATASPRLVAPTSSAGQKPRARPAASVDYNQR